MSELRVDTITDELGTGSPDFPNGITVSNGVFDTSTITASTIEDGAITGGTINDTPIGGTTASTGNFTNLAYTGTLTGGTGVVNLGSGQVVKDASGNVGIGTTAPDAKFQVSATSKAMLIGTASTMTPIFSVFLTGQSNIPLEISSNAIAGAGGSTLVLSNAQTGSGVQTGSISFACSGTSGSEKRSALVNSNLTAGSGSSVSGNLQFWTTNAGTIEERMRITSAGNVGIGTTAPSSTLTVNGSLSKSSGSFKIDHPLKPETHYLVHSFVEGPQADNLYRGKVSLVNGQATVNLDEAGRMTEGTFEALNCNVQCFTNNESGWTCVRGSVSGNILTIEAQDENCTDEISWMVIGERCDQHMIDTDWTDENGRVITEPEKEQENAD